MTTLQIVNEHSDTENNDDEYEDYSLDLIIRVNLLWKWKVYYVYFEIKIGSLSSVYVAGQVVGWVIFGEKVFILQAFYSLGL